MKEIWKIKAPIKTATASITSSAGVVGGHAATVLPWCAELTLY